jgi:hypothetical protein
MSSITSLLQPDSSSIVQDQSHNVHGQSQRAPVSQVSGPGGGNRHRARNQRTYPPQHGQYRGANGNEAQRTAEVDNAQAATNTEYRRFSVRQKVLTYLERAARQPIESAFQLAVIITRLSTTIFDQYEMPAELQFFEFFEQSINAVVSCSYSRLPIYPMSLFKLLNILKSASASNRLKSMNFSAVRAVEDALQDGLATEEDTRLLAGIKNIQDDLAIQKDAELLVEIEDIQDELTILEKVLDDQKSTTQKIREILGSDEDYINIDSHLQRIRTMLRMTKKTKKSARHQSRSNKISHWNH